MRAGRSRTPRAANARARRARLVAAAEPRRDAAGMARLAARPAHRRLVRPAADDGHVHRPQADEQPDAGDPKPLAPPATAKQQFPRRQPTRVPLAVPVARPGLPWACPPIHVAGFTAKAMKSSRPRTTRLRWDKFAITQDVATTARTRLISSMISASPATACRSIRAGV